MPQFDNTFQSLPSFFFEHVHPTPLTNPKLIHATDLRKKLVPELSDSDLLRWLNGELNLPGEERISTRYAGHQFGVWAGQLGDGRAISLGEMKLGDERFEIQTKGSGLTPFSRMGDGKAVVRSSVREYLCSEAMAGLGIPTTRVLGLITGEDQVYRETVERSALVARVFPSNLRFGHFEMAFHFKKEKELIELIQYTRETFFPGMTLPEMLREVVKRTAQLMAHWQNVGFCHGVMNTDNMSVLGLTIDYGPYGFLEDTVLNHVCNHSDHHGRYAYNQQPSIGMWNLERFLICFLEKVPKSELETILNSYPDNFENQYLRLSREKLGLKNEHPDDYQIFLNLLKILNDLSVDYTYFFRELSHYQRGGSLKGVMDYYGKRTELLDWLKLYDERLKLEDSRDEERNLRMLKTNPKYVLRNYIAQEVIEDVEKGNQEKLSRWLEVLYRPYDEHPELEAYALPTPPHHKNYIVSCSS
jgi:uncharacterized protein YdiU (UPF0061 family)